MASEPKEKKSADDAAGEAPAAPAEVQAPTGAAAGGQAYLYPQDEASVKARALASGSTLGTAEGDRVRCRAKGMFHEEANFQGRMLSPGDEFETSRGRAVELRANGLVEYCDKKLEDEARQDEPGPSMDNGVEVITSRSIRAPRRTA